MTWFIALAAIAVLVLAYCTFGYIIGCFYSKVWNEKWAAGEWWQIAVSLFLFPLRTAEVLKARYLDKYSDWQEKLENDFEIFEVWDPEFMGRVMAAIWPLGLLWTALVLFEGLFLLGAIVIAAPPMGFFYGIYIVGAWLGRQLSKGLRLEVE